MTIYESVRKGIEYIEANLDKNIGVLDVANSVSFSQFYFSREFSRFTHISLYDYILRRKISEAYKYLFSASPKIIDTAVKFGFQSNEVFSRAFKKVFGENPSEISVFKPILIYEPIDEHYLEFLSGLKIELNNSPSEEYFFEAQPIEESRDKCNYLVVLDENLFGYKEILTGKLKSQEDRNLSYRLYNLKHKIRIYHKDAMLSLRYFVNNYYDVYEMSCNFILINKLNNYIDIFIPG